MCARARRRAESPAATRWRDRFRAWALALPGAVEVPHFDRPSFRVAPPSKRAGTKPKPARIFATLWDDGRACLMLTPEQQAKWEDGACGFSAVPNKWGDAGATLVMLSGSGAAKAADVKAALREAWGNAARSR